MLTRLSIRNVVLIEALDLDFAGGLGVLTGETGAGKSILLDALGLVLGARADSGLVRGGEDQASVTASFEFAALPRGIATILAEAELDVEPGEPLLIKRRVKADGGSKAFVNDQPVSAALLRELSGHLVELHGQHDDRGLVNPRGHRALLDRFARADIAGVEAAWDKWRTAREALDGAREATARAAEDRDLLLAARDLGALARPARSLADHFEQRRDAARGGVGADARFDHPWGVTSDGTVMSAETVVDLTDEAEVYPTVVSPTGVVPSVSAAVSCTRAARAAS